MTTKASYLFNGHPDRVEAIWCIDSESGEECLVDLNKSQIIAKRVNGKIVDPSEGQKPC